MDPSSPILEAGKTVANQVDTITNLKHEWHKAAIDGDAETFIKLQELHCLLTPNGNTVLHVHLSIQNYRFRIIDFRPLFYWHKRVQASSLRSNEFVERILDKCPSLLWKSNAKGEIPLHIAAREWNRPGKADGRMKDKEGDTALHKAARYGHANVVRELLLADPDVLYSVNHGGEAPLYIAARRGYHRLVTMILDSSDSVDHQGPCGITALHAAVMAWSKRTTGEILRKRKSLVKATDENGQVPVHYATHLGYFGIVKLLLESDESAAYVIDKDKIREAFAVTAALVATVAFTAGFTLPGSYKSDRNRGTAILSHETAFKAFVISDAIAMISALLAVNFNYLTTLQCHRNFRLRRVE
ncbi:hypothetical protein V6N13_084419 [Hibiscus sabdariffa]|uniref:PGG domain-containing protein n=1 Tax=Hibiscus sabdariffa TaxID=183260 RepID=A0ABR2T1J0_9ROSI